MSDVYTHFLTDLGLAGGESHFLGAVNGGDYYNRIPNQASVWGTRRCPAGWMFPSIETELTELAESAATLTRCHVTMDLEKSGQPFTIARNKALVGSLQSAHRMVTGHSLPLAGMKYSADGSQFVNEGHMPAPYHVTDSTSAHSDRESAAILDLVRYAKVLLGTATGYLGTTVQF